MPCMIEAMRHGKFGMNKSNARILITGHTGFKGLWLSSLLKIKGNQIYGLSNCKEFKAYQTLEENIFADEFFVDIADFAGLDRAVRAISPDFIFHLAAQPLVQTGYSDPYQTFNSNSQGTLNLLEVIRRYGKIPCLVVTTDKVYANEELGTEFSENDKIWGKDPYSASKAMCEQIVDCYRRCYENCSAIYSARAGNVIGGGDYSENRLIPDVVRALKQNKPLVVRNPSATRPWQHVLEPIYGYYLYYKAIINQTEKLPYALNFGPSKKDNLAVDQVIALIQKHTNIRVEFMKREAKKFQNDEAELLSLDSSLAHQSLGWNGKLGIQSAIENTLNEYSALENSRCSHAVFSNAIEGYLDAG